MTDKSKTTKALKAFLATYHFEPIETGPQTLYDSEYIKTFYLRELDDSKDKFQLQLHLREHNHLIRILEDLFPNQLSRTKVSTELQNICIDWIENDQKIDNDKAIENTRLKLISNIKDSIYEYYVLVPIEGLIIKGLESVKLSKCLFKSNNSNSDLRVSIQNLEDKYKSFTNLDVYKDSPSFSECKTIAQSSKAIDNAISMVNQSLDIIRLYRGSYYFDLYADPSTQTRMGIARTFGPEDRSHAVILDASKEITEQIPGPSFRTIIDYKYELTPELLDFMSNHGLEKINTLLENPDSEKKDHISRRILRSITWFAQGTTANNLADSFIFYAISIEALLSEGRTSQHTYSRWVAALISQDDEKYIYPMDGGRSKEFSNNLKKTKSLTEKYKVVKDRCLRLFDYRNDIAHGEILDKNIDPVALLDIETISRNSILAFLNGPWASINDFKNWHDRSTWTEFDPK